MIGWSTAWQASQLNPNWLKQSNPNPSPTPAPLPLQAGARELREAQPRALLAVGRGARHLGCRLLLQRTVGGGEARGSGRGRAQVSVCIGGREAGQGIRRSWAGTESILSRPDCNMQAHAYSVAHPTRRWWRRGAAAPTRQRCAACCAHRSRRPSLHGMAWAGAQQRRRSASVRLGRRPVCRWLHAQRGWAILSGLMHAGSWQARPPSSPPSASQSWYSSNMSLQAWPNWP